MANPNYLGQGQPAAPSGGWLSGMFGGNTPSYIGATPATQQRTSLFTIAPAYQAAASTTSNDAAATQAQPTQIAIVIPRSVMDPQT